jgi:hypothetical protein
MFSGIGLCGAGSVICYPGFRDGDGNKLLTERIEDSDDEGIASDYNHPGTFLGSVLSPDDNRYRAQ